MSNYKYSQRVELGRNPVTGNRVRVIVHGETQAEFNRNLNIAKEKFQNKIADQLFKGQEFGVYADEWLEIYKNSSIVEVGTREMYTYVIRKIHKSSLEHKYMRNITESDCQKFLNEYSAYPRTCQKIKITLNQIFESAVRNKLVSENPAGNLILPKYIKNEKRVLTDEEKEAVRAVDLDRKSRMWLDILYSFGLRPEEMRALAKSDFDLQGGKLYVQRAQVWDGNITPVVKGTKNNQNRTLPIPDGIKEELERYIKTLKDDYLFRKPDKKWMTKDEYRKFADNILEAINRQLGGKNKKDALNGLTFYIFRHNFCSSLFYEGVAKGLMTCKMAASLCGHSEQVFLATYAHLDAEREWQATVDVMNTICGPKKAQNKPKTQKKG